ncbi:MAG: hypothetical protein ABFS32_13615 [Bacteroidota bacterium]
MKIFMSIIFLSAIMLTSCGNSQSNEGNEASANETDLAVDPSEESSDMAGAKDCEEFVDRYEKWVDDYLVLVDKYMKNPTDASLMEEFMKQAQEGQVFSTEWNSKLSYCASIEKYQKRFDEISDKANKKMEELGIE